MAKVYEIEGVKPVIDPDSFVHPDAVLIGDVIIGPECYIGPCACLRGDFGKIVVEKGANIQDSCVVHCFPGASAVIGPDAHIGHGAVIHGCVIKKNAMIGINAVVMDGAVIGKNSFVGAMSFVKSNFQVPDNVLVAGVPAKIMKELGEAEIALKSHGTGFYQKLATRSQKTMKITQPLTTAEPDRKSVDWSQ